VNAGPGTQAWVPVPVVNTAWQKSLESRFGGNAKTAAEVVEPVYGAKMVHATWADGETAPVLEVVSRIQAQDRRYDWSTPASASAPTETLLPYLKATALMPTDGIVLATAEKITANATTDEQKVRALFDWVVVNTYREPKVRGCGVGDIKAMLETGNMGGKCGDINALFVGMARSVGIPARDIYGIRVAKSQFGYKELGAGTPDITRAQHCRAEVWLAGRGLGRHGSRRRRQGDAPRDRRLDQDDDHPGRHARCTARSTAAGKATGWATTSRTTSRFPARRARSSGSSCTRRPRRAASASTASIRTRSSTGSRARGDG
jgi:transglutaminase-like putative cysteine protease